MIRTKIYSHYTGMRRRGVLRGRRTVAEDKPEAVPASDSADSADPPPRPAPQTVVHHYYHHPHHLHHPPTHPCDAAPCRRWSDIPCAPVAGTYASAVCHDAYHAAHHAAYQDALRYRDYYRPGPYCAPPPCRPACPASWC